MSPWLHAATRDLKLTSWLRPRTEASQSFKEKFPLVLFICLFVYLPVSGCCTAGSERMRVRAAAASSRAELPGIYVKQQNKRAVQGFQEKVSIYRAGKPIIVPEFQVRVEINDERRRRTWRRRWGAWARQGLLAACSRLRNNQLWSELEIKKLTVEATFNIGKACEDW